MGRAFKKMHGLGNDFVVIDARQEPFRVGPEAIRALADRRRGIGFDQLIVIDRPREGDDAFVRFYNADGGEISACGNGTRCVARLLFEETGKPLVKMRSNAGPLIGKFAGGAEVSVDMGAPRFDWKDIPLAERMDTRTLELQIGPIDDPILKQPSAASMGNPHCIFWVDRADAFDLEQIGPLVENHPLFPERCNVSLAEIRARNKIRVRVWERGVGVTGACGTAACAVLAAAARRNLADRHAEIELDGGTLDIEWRTDDDHIIMTGPAVLSFTGEFDRDLYPGSAA
ncbi:MAG: diaminopimelate epimerase [Alphaproteobacteria bacterium]